jgi:hypothetical protein
MGPSKKVGEESEGQGLARIEVSGAISNMVGGEGAECGEAGIGLISVKKVNDMGGLGLSTSGGIPSNSSD